MAASARGSGRWRGIDVVARWGGERASHAEGDVGEMARRTRRRPREIYLAGTGRKTDPSGPRANASLHSHVPARYISHVRLRLEARVDLEACVGLEACSLRVLQARVSLRAGRAGSHRPAPARRHRSNHISAATFGVPSIWVQRSPASAKPGNLAAEERVLPARALILSRGSVLRAVDDEASHEGGFVCEIVRRRSQLLLVLGSQSGAGRGLDLLVRGK